MADPVGIGCTIVALLQMSAKVISLTYNFLEAGRDAQIAITNLCSELRYLEGLLRSLHTLHDQHQDPPDLLVAEWKAWLQECHDLLEAFIGKLTPSPSRVGRLADRLRWPLREKDMEKLVRMIEQKKSSIVLGLNLGQT